MRPERESRFWKKAAVLLAISVTLVVVLVLVTGGCGGESGDDGDGVTTSTVVEVTTTTAPAPTTSSAPGTTGAVSTSVSSTEPPVSTSTSEEPTTTTEALSSAETRLANGDIKGMGFITRVWEEGGRRYISIDYAEMLSGEEARQAAVDAGLIQPDEDLPNDYFIRNVNPLLREFAVSADVSITTSTRHGVMDEPATWEEFLSFFGPTPPEGATHLKNVPWWIVRTGTEVHSIDEQYLP